MGLWAASEGDLVASAHGGARLPGAGGVRRMGNVARLFASAAALVDVPGADAEGTDAECNAASAPALAHGFGDVVADVAVRD